MLYSLAEELFLALDQQEIDLWIVEEALLFWLGFEDMDSGEDPLMT